MKMAREKDELKKKKSISVAVPKYLVDYCEKMAFKNDVSISAVVTMAVSELKEKYDCDLRI